MKGPTIGTVGVGVVREGVVGSSSVPIRRGKHDYAVQGLAQNRVLGIHPHARSLEIWILPSPPKHGERLINLVVPQDYTGAGRQP